MIRALIPPPHRTDLAGHRGPVANALEGTVVGVTDGDTVTVLDANKVQYKIRLAGIDAPEKDQPFGQRSKQSLSNAVMGKHVRVEWSKQDRYGRLVGKVWVTPVSHPCTSKGEPCPKTLDVGRAQLTVGLAWHFKKYEREQSEEDRLAYAFDEQEARARKAGLWSEPDPTPPWDWRTAPPPADQESHVKRHLPRTRNRELFVGEEVHPVPTLDACLASGGRLPKNVDSINNTGWLTSIHRVKVSERFATPGFGHERTLARHGKPGAGPDLSEAANPDTGRGRALGELRFRAPQTAPPATETTPRQFPCQSPCAHRRNNSGACARTQRSDR